MQDGLYFAQFAIGQATGYGVMVKSGNRVSGGNDSYWWVGDIAFPSDDTFETTLTVKQFRPSDGSPFGFFDSLPISLTGEHNRTSWRSKGATAAGVPAEMNLRILLPEFESAEA